MALGGTLLGYPARRSPSRLALGGETALRRLRRVLLTIACILVPLQLGMLALTGWYDLTISRGYANAGVQMLPGQDDGRVLGEPVGRFTRAAGIARGDRLLTIDGETITVPDDTIDTQVIADRLAGTGPVRLALQRTDGRRYVAQVQRGAQHVRSEAGYWPLGWAGHLWIVLLAGAVMHLSLSVTAIVLLLRRWRDPVAITFAAAFLAIVGGSDRVGALFRSLVAELLPGLFTATWLAGLTIAIAAFPDGRFHPRRAGLLVWIAPPVALAVGLPLLPELIDAVLAILLVGSAVVLAAARLRTADGVVRQQIKWAGVGFATGIVVLALASGLLRLCANGQITGSGFFVGVLTGRVGLAVGFAAFPLSLLVAMLRFRLWDVDRVISRSSSFGFVTVLLGGAFAGAQEVGEILVCSVGGMGDSTSTAWISAAMIAVLFPPLQNRVGRWTERHLHEPIVRIDALPQQLERGHLRTPADVLARATDALAGATAAVGADAWLQHADRWERVAVTGKVAVLGETPDGNGAAFFLMLGDRARIRLAPRPDGSGYARDLRRAMESVAPALAEVVEQACLRADDRDAIDQLSRRLAALERAVTGRTTERWQASAAPG